MCEYVSQKIISDKEARVTFGNIFESNTQLVSVDEKLQSISSMFRFRNEAYDQSLTFVVLSNNARKPFPEYLSRQACFLKLRSCNHFTRSMRRRIAVSLIPKHAQSHMHIALLVSVAKLPIHSNQL